MKRLNLQSPSKKWFDSEWFKLRKEHRQGHILVCVALWSMISFLVFSRYVLATVVVQGTSMEPNLHEGDRLLLNRVKPVVGAVKRGDVVVINDRGNGEFAIKRVVGLPKDSIELIQGKVFVNGIELKEFYLPRGMKTWYPSRRARFDLGENHYFVLGDNRPVSEDSRYYGPVDRSKLMGVIF